MVDSKKSVMTIGGGGGGYGGEFYVEGGSQEF